jgi:hypothetical protein
VKGCREGGKVGAKDMRKSGVVGGGKEWEKYMGKNRSNQT